MEEPKLLYGLSLVGEIGGYTNNTILHSSTDSEFEVFGDLGSAMVRVGYSHEGDISKVPVILKFEYGGNDVPSQIGINSLTQIGFRVYEDGDLTRDVLNGIQEQLRISERGNDIHKHYRLEDRIGVMPFDRFDTSVADKIIYFTKLERFNQRIRRKLESGVNLVDSSGMPNEEVVSLMGIEYSTIMGNESPKAKYLKEGITLEQAELIANTGLVFHEFGKGFTSMGSRATESAEVSSPFGDEMGDLYRIAGKFVKYLEMFGPSQKSKIVGADNDLRIRLPVHPSSTEEEASLFGRIIKSALIPSPDEIRLLKESGIGLGGDLVGSKIDFDELIPENVVFECYYDPNTPPIIQILASNGISVDDLREGNNEGLGSIDLSTLLGGA